MHGLKSIYDLQPVLSGFDLPLNPSPHQPSLGTHWEGEAGLTYPAAAVEAGAARLTSAPPAWESTARLLWAKRGTAERSLRAAGVVRALLKARLALTPAGLRVLDAVRAAI